MEQARFLKQNAAFRVLILLCFFASSIGDAFNTVFIRQMLSVSGMDRELLISLPITAMSAMMVLGVLVSGQISGRMKHFKSYLRIGILILFAGLLLRGLAFDYYILTAGFAVSGFGTGLLFIGIRYYAFMFQNRAQRTAALSYIIGGSFVGQCLGTVLGGILAGQIDNRYIFLFSAFLLLVPFVMANHIGIEGKLSGVKYAELFGVLKNRRALLYLICVVLPMFACSVYVPYSVPLYVNDYGYSSNVTSVLILANYLLSAYLGPYLVPKMLAVMSGARIILLYLLLTAGMLMLYVAFPSMWMLTIVVTVTGLLDAFGLTVAIDAFAATRHKEKNSDNSSLIVFYLFSRIGQMLGPTMISLTGSLTLLAVFPVIGASVFLLTLFVNGAKAEQ